MAHYMKKGLALFLVMALCLSLCIPVFANEKTVVDLTKRTVITEAGLSASSVYTKNGDYSAELSGRNLKKNFSFQAPKDWSAFNMLNLWVYSPVGIQTPITFLIVSDNPETLEKDYYYLTDDFGSLGWNRFSVCYNGEDSEFDSSGSPLGLSNVTGFEILTSYGDYKAKSGAQLYFDKVTISFEEKKENSSSGSQGGSGQGSTGESGGETGEVAEETVLFSDINVGASTVMLGTPPVIDFTPYNTIIVRAKNEKKFYTPLMIWFQSENPNNYTNDYWYTYIDGNWTGEKEFVFDRGGKGFHTGALPLGWDQITSMRICTWDSAVLREQGKLDNDVPELFIESISLTNRDWSELYAEGAGNYIPEAREPEEGFVDYASQIRAAGKGHPRLFMGEDYIKEISSLSQTDLYLNSTLTRLKNNVQSTIKSEPDGTSSVSILAEAAALYNISPSTELADWIWKGVIKSQTLWIDLGTYLTVGDSARYLSYVYDFMYNHWTEEQRTICRNILMHNGLDFILRELRPYVQYAQSYNNLSTVMMSAVGTVALAVMGDDPAYDAILNESLNRSLVSLRHVVPNVAYESGEYREGFAYWNYGLGLTFLPFVANMYNVLDNSEFLDNYPGVANAALYPIGLTGAKGCYNYGDSQWFDYVACGAFFFLSQYYDNPAFGAYQKNYTPEGGDFYAMMMYRADERYDDFEKYMPTSTYFPDVNEVMTIRRSWEGTDGTFLGVKGGKNFSGTHMQTDIGSYIFDMMGVRWACELGLGNYSIETLHELGRQGGYRNRAEGQNTLVINPKGGRDQNVNVDCKIENYKITDNGGYIVMDLSQAYEGMGADSVKRGFAMLNNYGSLLIQDEIKSTAPIEVYSFMHTQSDIEIAPDGKSAVLTQDGKKMRAKLLSPANGTLLDMPADPLPDSPDVPGRADNSGYRKLTVHVKDAESPTLALLLTAYAEDPSLEYSIEKIKPIRKMQEYMKNPIEIESLSLDGVPIHGFDPKQSSYTVSECEVGEVTAQAKDGIHITISQAKEVGDVAVVTATDQNGYKAVYTVNFSREAQNRMEVSSYIIKTQTTVDGVSDYVAGRQWGHGTPGSRWIIYDLGRSKEVRDVNISWSQGDIRYAYFTLLVSNDNKNWKTVYDGQSLLQGGFEKYSFDPQKARYIKIDGHGNSVNSWTNILGVSITAYEDAFNDVSGHWAEKDILDLANLGILYEPEDGKLNPEKEVTRADFISLLQKTVKYSDAAYTGAFADVTAQSDNVGAIEGAYALGFIPAEMVADGNFLPNQPITCEEMLAIGVNTVNILNSIPKAEKELTGYRFVDQISPWCVPYMKNAMAMKLLGGSLLSEDFIANQNATYAQAIVMAKRLYIKTY